MVVINSMAGRSQLELMLDKLQQSENDQLNVDVPPPLPVRPVSRARRPRAMKPLIVDSQSETYKIEAETIEMKSADSDYFLGECMRFDGSKEISLKTICDIQKFYRGHKVHCYYKKLREGVITLQSFVRGENARREYDRYRIKWLSAIVMIQKQVRSYFSRADTGSKQGLDQVDSVESVDEKAEDGSSKSMMESRTKVKHSVLVDLQRRVLRTEAKARRRNEENVTLKRQIEEIESKWRLYEVKMNTLERTWQDQFTYIQERLYEAKKNQCHEIGIAQQFDSARNSNSDSRRSDFIINGNRNGEAEQENISHKLNPQGELRKLKAKFKLWKKEYRHKLRQVQSVFKRSGNNPQPHKKWRGKIIT